MDEPDFISQSADHTTVTDRDRWARAEQLDMIQQGANFTRISPHPTIKHLTLVEGWRSSKPALGQPMFSVTDQNPSTR